MGRTIHELKRHGEQVVADVKIRGIPAGQDITANLGILGQSWVDTRDHPDLHHWVSQHQVVGSTADAYVIERNVGNRAYVSFLSFNPKPTLPYSFTNR